MKLYKIYKYTHLIIGMSYIGQTYKTLKQRAGQGMKGYRGCHKFWEAIQNYGTDCWRVEILWDGLTLDEANIYEQVEIRDNETLYPYGYNLSEGGMGVNPSQETRQKMSESIKKAFAESPEIWYEAQRLATEAAAKKTRGVPRPKEVREKISIGHRKPDYAEMHDFFLSLPTDMHVSEKTRLLRERFPNVGKNTIYFRLRQWTGLKGSKRLPAYQETYEFYLTLPADMPLPKKRHLLQKEFPDVSRHYVNRWLNQWSGTQTLKRHPNYSDVNDLFLTLPLTMSLSEKRRLLYKEFPNIKKDTIRSWTHTDVDEGVAGYIFSEEPKKQKLSESNRDKTRKKTLSTEHRQNLSEANKNSPKVQAHLKKLAKQPRSAESRQKQSEAMTGFKHSDESRQLMSEKAKEREAKKRAEGYVVSEQARRNISKGLRNRDNSCYTPEVRKTMSIKAKEREARKKAEGYTVSDETRRKKSEASQKMWNERRPAKHLAKEVYLTLDPNLPIKEKRKILYKQFPDVYQGAVSQWTREWERELTGTALTLKGGKKEEYTPARTLFFSLPTTISLAEKRKVIFDKFLGSVGQKTLYAWTLEWESEIHPSRENHRIRLDKIPVQQFFCSLPIEMPIKEKRERVCAEFPSVAQRTIHGWMHEWHIELTGSPPPREPWNKGKTGVYSDETLRQIREARSRQVCPMRRPEYNEAHKFYLTLPHNMSISEKRKSLCKKYPNPSPKTIWRWTKQWQSELEATQQP